MDAMSVEMPDASPAGDLAPMLVYLRHGFDLVVEEPTRRRRPHLGLRPPGSLARTSRTTSRD